MAQEFSITLTAEQKSRLWGTFQDSGTLPETSGVILGYIVTHVNGDAVILFTVIKKPFYVPVDAIKSHIKGLLGL